MGYLAGDGINYSNNTGLWTEGGGNGLRLLAREGDQVPDLSDGIHFGEFYFSDSPILNANGQSAFTARLTGVGIDSSNNMSILAEDMTGNVHLIARTGNLLDVSDDPMNPDMRTIGALSFQTRSGNDDGKASGFNDRGQLAFWARFTDGTEGIFVSNLVAVPEPACLLAAFLSFFAFCLSRFRTG
jgi:hypothetical protein